MLMNPVLFLHMWGDCMLSEEKVTEYLGYSIYRVSGADHDDFEVWKNGRKIISCETQEAAEEYINDTVDVTEQRYRKEAVDKILSGVSIREAISPVVEANNYNENNAVFKVRDWLTRNTYNYEITNVEILGVKVDFAEIDPDGQKSYGTFTVKSDGHIYNENGEDVVRAALDAYDNDPDMQKEIKSFAEKWYD